MTLNEYLKIKEREPKTDQPIDKVSLDEEFKLLVSDIKCHIYKKDNRLIYALKLPSRSAKGTYYDIIIDVNIGDNTGGTVDNLDFMCYSNSPSFIYTYAHTFREKGLICPWLVSKYENITMRNTATQRNPDNQIYRERSLYLSILYIIKTGKNRISNVLPSATTIINYLQLSVGINSQTGIKKKLDKTKTDVKKEREKLQAPPPRKLFQKKLSSKTVLSAVGKKSKSSGKTKSTKTVKKT